MNGWDRFATGGDSTVENGGFTMVRNGPTKRKRGDIWAQLSVSACVLLLPPLVMAAGVMVLGSSSPQGQQGAVQEAAALQAPAAASTSVSVAGRSDMRPDSTTSFALASAETHPVITEKRNRDRRVRGRRGGRRGLDLGHCRLLAGLPGVDEGYGGRAGIPGGVLRGRQLSQQKPNGTA
jgi:hypothetical protein